MCEVYTTESKTTVILSFGSNTQMESSTCYDSDDGSVEGSNSKYSNKLSGEK